MLVMTLMCWYNAVSVDYDVAAICVDDAVVVVVLLLLMLLLLQ